MSNFIKVLIILNLIALCSHLGHCAQDADEHDLDESALLESQQITGKSSMTDAFLMKQAYKLISKHISGSSVEMKNPANYIEEAAKWMESINDDPQKSATRFNKHLLKALKQFTALREIDEGNRCNAHSYNILVQNDQATGGVARVKDDVYYKTLFINRADRIVHDYGKKHAIECRSVYPAEFKRRIVSMDKDLVARVDALSGNILENFTKQTDENHATFLRDMAFHDQYKPISKPTLAKAMREVAKQFGNNDSIEPEGLFKQPCQYYVEKLGPGLIQVANYDQLILDRQNFYPDQRADVTDFVKALYSYRLCSKLIA